MKENINFFIENVNYVIRKKKILRKWISDAIRSERKAAGDINIVICDDEYLCELNSKYLKHSTLTDILTLSLIHI